MPWIREIKPQDADLNIVAGTRVCRRYWGDHESGHLARWHPVEKVTRDDSGRVTIETHYYTEEGGAKPHKMNFYVNPKDVLAYIMREGKSHESRLYLDGGYLIARAGENLRGWDVYRNDGTLIREGVTTEEGRKLIERQNAAGSEVSEAVMGLLQD